MSQNKLDIYGADSASNALPTGLAANSEGRIFAESINRLLAFIVVGVAALFRLIKVVTATAFTRPADTTAYASGDLVANSTTAGSVVPIQLSVARINGGAGQIKRVRLKKSGTGVTNAAFRVHFYTATPVPSNGDNGAWLTTDTGWIGSFDVTIDKAFTASAQGVGIPTTGTELSFNVAAGAKVLFALIEARGVYTPASAETFTLAAEVIQS